MTIRAQTGPGSTEPDHARSSEQSNIQVFGQQHEPIKIVVTRCGEYNPAHDGPGALVWIDKLDGSPIANVRLTVEDCKALITRLAQTLNPEVYGHA